MNRMWVGTRKGLFSLGDGASSALRAWNVEALDFRGVPVTAVLVDPRDGSLYAGLKHGHFGSKLHRSRDGGKSWQAVATPGWPEKPAGVEDKDGSGREWPWSLDTIWVLEAGGADLPGELWCGTIPGGLFRSTDHGDSWTLCRGLWDHPGRNQWFGGGADWPGIHSVCVHPKNPNDLVIGVSCGGVWRSEDRGQTWQCTSKGMYAEFMPPDRREDPLIQDPHRLVRSPSAPDRLWAQHHNGVFQSFDAGRSWVEVKNVPPSKFGFAVTVHPRHADTAWLLPATSDELRIPVDGAVVAARTRDAGKSFEVLRNGLPQKNAYDLVYRHAFDIAADGATLAFGSTTGNLWATHDEGDSWQCVLPNLPPVYCLRLV